MSTGYYIDESIPVSELLGGRLVNTEFGMPNHQNQLMMPDASRMERIIISGLTGIR
jgi:hypothetical protein